MRVRLLSAVLLAGVLVVGCKKPQEKAPSGAPIGSGTPASGAAGAPPAGGDPHAGGGSPHTGGEDPHAGGEEKPDPMIMVHLMNRFCAALAEKPTNKNPASNWDVLLVDPANPIVCADCHKPEIAAAMSKFPASQRPEGTERWEQDEAFMKRMMASWMKKANTSKAREKLKADLTCKSCHGAS